MTAIIMAGLIPTIFPSMIQHLLRHKHKAPKQTVIVEKTVLVTEPPKETVVVEKTILVTEPPTETMIVENTVLVTETKEPTTTKVVAAVNLDDQSKDDSSKENDSSWLGLLLIGAGILVLAGLAGALIVSYAKRSKEKAAGSVQFHSPWEDQDSPMNPYAGESQNLIPGNHYPGSSVCPNCGTICTDPNAKFCERCGTLLR